MKTARFRTFNRTGFASTFWERFSAFVNSVTPGCTHDHNGGDSIMPRSSTGPLVSRVRMMYESTYRELPAYFAPSIWRERGCHVFLFALKNRRRFNKQHWKISINCEERSMSQHWFSNTMFPSCTISSFNIIVTYDMKIKWKRSCRALLGGFSIILCNITLFRWCTHQINGNDMHCWWKLHEK